MHHHQSQCQNCEHLKIVGELFCLPTVLKLLLEINFISPKELSQAVLKSEQFQSIAKSIVQTDLLLRRLAEKEKEISMLRNELDASQEYSKNYFRKYFQDSC